MTTGNRITLALLEKGITQAELAKRIGATEVSVSRWITGKREMRISWLAKIARALNVSTDWLLGLDAEVAE